MLGRVEEIDEYTHVVCRVEFKPRFRRLWGQNKFQEFKGREINTVSSF
jgi:hypothetical protein